VDAEWIALISEAKALGLTVDEIREWLAEMNKEKGGVR
jgi:DNA-binding transcriptional MerR regulator